MNRFRHMAEQTVRDAWIADIWHNLDRISRARPLPIVGCNPDGVKT